MNEYFIKQYERSDFLDWNNFISKSTNGTFLFDRNFMEYHSDRFTDFSLLIFKNKKLAAVLPANRLGDSVFSHQGLTFGGFIFIENFGAEIIESFVDTVLSFMKKEGIKYFNYKKMPSFYADYQINQIDYFLLKRNASVENTNMNLAINYAQKLNIAKGKLKHFRNSDKNDLLLKEENSLESFWNLLLIPRLEQRHNAKPVHTLDEISKLKAKFPENIKQFNVYYKTELVAGITLFCSTKVVKSQYGATSDLGEKLRALDFAFIKLINFFKDDKRFFDMGTVNNPDGSYNKGLLKQKEELGCEVYSLDTYKIII